MFLNNLEKKIDPRIIKCKEYDNWNIISFEPDLAKINMPHLKDDVLVPMKKRIVYMVGGHVVALIKFSEQII